MLCGSVCGSQDMLLLAVGCLICWPLSLTAANKLLFVYSYATYQKITVLISY